MTRLLLLLVAIFDEEHVVRISEARRAYDDSNFVLTFGQCCGYAKGQL